MQLQILEEFITDHGVLGYYYDINKDITIEVYPKSSQDDNTLCTIRLNFKFREEYYSSSFQSANNVKDFNNRLKDLVDSDTCRMILNDIFTIDEN